MRPWIFFLSFSFLCGAFPVTASPLPEEPVASVAEDQRGVPPLAVAGPAVAGAIVGSALVSGALVALAVPTFGPLTYALVPLSIGLASAGTALLFVDPMGSALTASGTLVGAGVGAAIFAGSTLGVAYLAADAFRADRSHAHAMGYGILTVVATTTAAVVGGVVGAAVGGGVTVSALVATEE